MKVTVTIVAGRAAGKSHLARRVARSLKRYRNPQMEFEVVTQLGPRGRREVEFSGRGAPWGRG